MDIWRERVIGYLKGQDNCGYPGAVGRVPGVYSVSKTKHFLGLLGDIPLHVCIQMGEN